MPLPLPAGPDYPLWMPPDGLMDRTRGAVTDWPHAVGRAPRSSAPVVKRQATAPAADAGTSPSSVATQPLPHGQRSD
jgi:hypothetical protein